MTTACTTKVREISKLDLSYECPCADEIRWSDTEFYTCQFCGTSTPVGYMGRIKLPPYPCNCKESKEFRESYVEYEPPKPPEKPQRYQGVTTDCEVYADRIINGQGIYLYGKSGRGKTQIAHDTKVAVEARGLSVRIYKAKELITEINEALGEQNALFSRLRKCDLLIIDDLGTENVTESAVLNIQRVLDERCDDMKPVFITSNYSRGELATRYDSVNPVAAAAIASRLAQMTISEEIEGKDWRAA